MLTVALIVLLSYLVGSIPTSVWLGKARHGIDVRQHGSGNAGATNVFRVLGWKSGTAVLLLDALKGWTAAGVVSGLRVGPLPSFGGWNEAAAVGLIAGVAAVVGHTYPVFAGFKGGKGVATSAGVLLALTLGSGLVTIATFVLVLVTTRFVSLASLAGAVAYPASLFAQKFVFGRPLDPSFLVLGTLMGATLFYTHRANIGRLMRGEERRVRSFRPTRGSGRAAGLPSTPPSP